MLFLFTWLTILSSGSKAYARTEICRSHFAQNDVLNTFSSDEKASLETAASTLASLLGKSSSDDLRVKKDLDDSIQRIILNKKLNKKEEALFTTWIQERIRFYINLKKQVHSEISEKEKSAAETLQRQKIEFEKFRPMIQKYKAQNWSEALVAAYESTDSENPKKHEDILYILSYFKHLEITDEIFRIVVQYDNLAAVEYFVHQGINLSSKDDFQETPLHFARRNPSAKIIEFLIQADGGANVNSQNLIGRTPLHLMAKNDAMKIETLQLALKFTNRTQINLKDWTGRVPLGKTPLHLALESQNIEFIKILLDAGADPTQQDEGGKNALHYTFYRSKNILEILQLLLVRDKPSIHYILRSADRKGLTPLHLAIQQNLDIEVIKLLIQADAGAQLNAITLKGETPLHYAAGYLHPKIIKILLDAGANPTLKNDQMNTPYEFLDLLLLDTSNQTPKKQKKILTLLRLAMEKWEREHPP